MHPDDPVALAAHLISIQSVNPDLAANGRGESAIASYCAEWLAERGFSVSTIEPIAGRPSVVAILHGSGGGRSLMLNGHLDTVTLGATAGTEPTERDGRLFGRGAFDMKGGVAAIMVAAARAAASGVGGDVIVTLVADEEFGSSGTEAVLAAVRADAAIVTEPSEMELIVAHRGFAWFRVDVAGRAAHGSLPHQGVDAIAHAGLLIRALDDFRDRLEALPPHPLLGHGTVRIATIAGGVDAATVAPSCTMTIERRTLPGESPDDVEAELRLVLSSVAGVDWTLTRLVARGAFEADQDGPIARALASNAERILGAPAAVRGEPFWTEAGLIQDAGIPCILLGVDGGGAHADEEWATTESIRQLTDILEGTIREFCA